MTASDNTTPHSAADYDASVRQTIPHYELMQAEVVDLALSLRPDARLWVDTGCGTGYLISLALGAFPATGFVLTDPAEAMLGQAKARLEQKGQSRIRFLPSTRSEGLRLPGNDKPQIVTAILCHHYLQAEQRRSATRACHDVLEKGGAYITIEHTAAGNDAAQRVNMDRWRRFQLARGRTEAEVAHHLGRFGTSYFPITAAEHLRLLRETGFAVAEVFWSSFVDTGFYAVKY